MLLVTRVIMGFFVLLGLLFAPVAAFASTYTVSPGDTLFLIARSHGVTVDKLIAANKLGDTVIYSGQQLNIPDEKSQTYTIKSGDTLYLIGKKFGVSYQEIMSENGLKSTAVYPGMLLKITAPPVASVSPVPPVSPVPAVGGSTGTDSQASRGGGSIQRPDPADVDLLARLITAEADSEPYECKVSVGAVVLNRVASPKFPNSVTEVVYQHDNWTYQFEPVQNGWITRPASVASLQAAKEALSGSDPTNGALYFFADSVDSPWLRSRKVSRVIGHTVFTY